MLCEKCGKEIPDGSTFCGYCGAQTVLKKKNKKPFIIGGCFITLVAIFCIVFFVGKHIKEQRQEADMESAKTIAASIREALSEDAVSTDMQQYSGIPISLEEDMKYLPQSFQDQFQKRTGEIPSLQYTKDGAAGFSFLIDKNNKVTVYISSNERLDEWQIYPEVSDRYYDGEKQKPEKSDSASAINNSEYSYVRLISKESPILGYWQGEHAGMYVGYNTAADEEGFIIYLYTSDKWVEILHYYEGYAMTGDMGQINYSKEYYNVDVIVEDESHITIHFQSDSYEGDEYISEYTFTKGELDDSLMQQFGGKWNGGLSEFGVGPDFELTYDKGYHFTYSYGDGTEKCVHKKTKREGGYYEMPHICLYNGQGRMIFISPRGEFGGVMAFESYELGSISSDNNQSILSVGLRGGGGGMDYTLYRDGSEEDKMQNVLLAYENYINSLDTYDEDQQYYYYKLIYVDDDDIPELVVLPENGCIMCTYKDGEVMVLVNSSSTLFQYKKKSGYYLYGDIGAKDRYEKLEDGTSQLLAYIGNEADEEGFFDYYYYIGDDEVPEDEYYDYVDTISEGFEDAMEDMYSSIYEAYENMD